MHISIPESEKWKCAKPSIHGEYFGKDGAECFLLAPSTDGAWVFFGKDRQNYMGVPARYLKVS